jgi:protein phosphatase
MMTIHAGAYTARGIRPQNEDSFLIADSTGGAVNDSAVFSGGIDGPLFFLAADGMGGHAAGDAASAFVVENMRNSIKNVSSLNAASLEAIIRDIHARLLREGTEKGTPNMGSTLTGIVLQKGDCAFFNVGDSRVYRLRGGYIQQLSHDDSLSTIVPGAAKNIITNAMGAGIPEITVQCRFAPSLAVAGDVFLMCSDGVHGAISDDELEALLNQDADPAEIARRIVEKAIANDSDDNCTAVLVRIGA